MYFVYVLYSSQYGETYVGYTSDLNGRLLAHNHPQNKGYTKRYQPWEVIHFETFSTKQEAMTREKIFKTGKGREELIDILKSKGLR